MKMRVAQVAVLALLALPAPASADVTDPPASTDPPLVFRSSGALVGGIVVASVGGTFMLAGAGVALGRGCSATSTSAFNSGCESGNPTIAAGLAIAGAITVAIGIPLMIYGAGKVPSQTDPGAVKASLPLRVLGHPGPSGWAWSF